MMQFHWSISILLLIILLLLPVVWWLLGKNTGKKLPPARTGWFPWIGVAYEFGKSPLLYIDEAKKELGDVFTVHAAGRKMTFLLDHSHSDVFFKSPSASFQGAAQSFTVAAANISPESFYQHHSKIHDIFKGRLTSSNLPPLCLSLSACFYQQLLNCKEKEIELIQLVRDIMFPIVFQQLCGNANLNLSQDQMDLVQDKFIKYDAGFEYAQLPSILNREWCGTKAWLLDVFKDVVMKFVQRNEPPQSVFEHIISSVDGDNAAGYALMMLWASQANAIPIAFWTLSFVLSHPQVLEKIKDELKDLSFVNENGDFVEVTESQLKSFSPTIKRSIMEAIRLRSPGVIVRKITEPISIKDYTIPAGHYLMLSPYYCHRNPKYFPNPESFDPDRWIECDVDKGQFLPGFIGFGGGRYQCPGRWFALMELHLLLTMIFKLLHLELVDPVPSPSTLHLVGSQQPSKCCRVVVKKCIE